MLVLTTDDLKKLELKYKPFKCPRCGAEHREAAEWMACRLLEELKKR